MESDDFFLLPMGIYKKAIDLIGEGINAIHGTIEDLDETKYDWVIANGVFNLGLKEDMTFF